MHDYTAEYPGQVLTTDPTGYPYGEAKNQVTPGDGTGTPLERKWVNDVFGFFQSILYFAGQIVPSGASEKVGGSQLFGAIHQSIRQEHGLLNWHPVMGDHIDATYGWPTGSFRYTGGFTYAPQGGAYDADTRLWLVVGGTDGCAVSGDDGRTFQIFDGGMSSTISLLDVAVSRSTGLTNQSAVVVGSSTTAYRRTDLGSGTWSGVTLPGTPTNVYSVLFDDTNDRFVAVGDTATGPYATTSDDNVASAWTDRSASLPASFAGMSLNALAGNAGGIVVAAAKTAHTKLAVSTDGGITWADSTTTLASGIYGLTYNLHRAEFYAVDLNALGATSVYSSTDGLTWTLVYSADLHLTFTPGGYYRSVASYGAAIIVLGNIKGDTSAAISYSLNGGLSWNVHRLSTTGGDNAIFDDGYSNKAISPFTGATTQAHAGAATPRLFVSTFGSLP